MKRIGSGQLLVTAGDKVVVPNLIGASRMGPSSPGPHQQLLLHSILEDGTSQVTCPYMHLLCHAPVLMLQTLCVTATASCNSETQPKFRRENMMLRMQSRPSLYAYAEAKCKTA